MKDKILFANVTNSIGELDVLLPLFSKLNELGGYKFILHLTSAEFIEKYDESDFYKFCIKELDVELIKLDLLPIRANNKNIFKKICNRLIYCINIIKILPYYCKANIYIHDYTGHRLILYPIYFFARLKKAKIFAIPHGLGVQIDTRIIDRADIIGKVTMLVFDFETNDFHRNYGYKNIINIGYVKFYNEWVKLLELYRKKKSIVNKKKIVVLSRHVHELYMDYEKYIYLLTSFFEYAKRRYSSHEICIKIHPRESSDLIKEIANKCNINVTILRDHPGVACMDASLVVSFWTSAIIDASVVGTLSIEYYQEADNFRMAEPAGSVFKKIGFRSASNIEDLEKIVNKYSNNFDPKKYYEKFYCRVLKNMPTNANIRNIFSNQ